MIGKTLNIKALNLNNIINYLDVSMRRVESIIVDGKKSRARPRITWDEQINIDLDELNLSADFTRDRSS